MKRIIAFGVIALLWTEVSVGGEDLLIGKWIHKKPSGEIVAFVFEPDGTSQFEHFDENTNAWVRRPEFSYYWSITSSPNHYILLMLPIESPNDDVEHPLEYELTFLSPDTIELQRILTSRGSDTRSRVRYKALFTRQGMSLNIPLEDDGEAAPQLGR